MFRYTQIITFILSADGFPLGVKILSRRLRSIFLLLFCDMQNAGVLVLYRRSGGLRRKETGLRAFPGWRLAASSSRSLGWGSRAGY